jgi:hypothetical protein
MRYIWEHDELARLLLDRRQDRPLIKAAFFFHYRGSHVQKSFEGMLHSILFRILNREPRLVKVLLREFLKEGLQQRERWLWTLPKLMMAYEAILTQNTSPVDLLFFIDALDEYDGPPEAIVDFLRTSLQKSSQGATRLKLCVSSREWTAFEDSFAHEPGFKIHERTQDDIRRYILSRLPTGRTDEERSDIREIEKTINHRANGVFIWVKAVIDEICRLFLKTTPTKELLRYLEGIPDDLDQFYTDAIKRIPHEYRMEAYLMFEVILRARDRSLFTYELAEAVSCAGLDSLDDCLSAIVQNRTKPGEPDCCGWVKDRGAGLLELGVIVLTSDGKRVTHQVQFMHQTVLDFVSRPGFRSIILGGAFELPLENGYSLLAKWLFARAEGANRMEPGAPAISPTNNVLALAESTTGRSLKRFLDAVDVSVIARELRDLDLYEHIADPKIAFAAVQSLTILLQEFIQEHNGRLPDRGGFSPLHCLCKVANRQAIGIKKQMVFPFSMPVDVPVATLLLGHGATVHARYKGRTPWEILFQDSYYNYRKFQRSPGLESLARVNALAGHLLRAGQDPDTDLQVIRTETRTLPQAPDATFIVSKALHIATEDLAKLLLRLGANVNALDSEGLTALDLACGVRPSKHGNELKVTYPRQLKNAYALAALLLRHGGRVTKKGRRRWPGFLEDLDTHTDESIFSDEFREPPVLRHATARALAEKVKRLGMRVTRGGG